MNISHEKLHKLREGELKNVWFSYNWYKKRLGIAEYPQFVSAKLQYK
jgi:hypothetical protein